MARPGSKRKILVVDDDMELLGQLTRNLESSGVGETVPLSLPSLVMERLSEGDISVMLLDLVMPGASGADILRTVTANFPEIPVIMMTAVTDVSTAVDCIKSGAFDYLTKPLDTARLYSTVTRAVSFSELTSENRHLKKFLLGEPLANPEIFAKIITRDAKMQSIFKLVETVATTLHPVLITGETGAGKELFARAIHDTSGVSGEFVAVNVAGLDETMFHDMIFGHRRGAYTGASESRDGLIKKASGGTLFLDEIGDMSPGSQKMLLRLLQEKEYYRLGSDILYQSDARIIAASNCNFKEIVAKGSFRQDLFHRLAIHQIKIPALRERSCDIPMLAEHFAEESAKELSKSRPELSQDLKMALAKADLPGNVRELMNMVRNAVACNRNGRLDLSDFEGLSPALQEKKKGVVKVSCDGGFTLYAAFDRFPSIDEVEELLVQEAMRVSGGNKGIAADLLGVSRPTLNKKLESVNNV
ncbi:MAG: sigma-54-dependent Fis family transcriptional regulator [Geobacteraceae bacterium]|nr:sigma-54-dependent Fis family transcriptional regulator [Geobacteraceae bacterium]